MGWAFIFTGPILFLVGLAIAFSSISPMTSQFLETRQAGFKVLSVGLAMVTAGVGLTALGANQEQQRREKVQRRRERDRLYNIFLQLLKEGNGNIAVLQFAIATGLDGYAARAYLDEQAKALNAAYNVTQEGKFTYYFDLEGADVTALAPLPGDWS
jgi:uncharacterized membrane protein YidH (DUF202 family)